MFYADILSKDGKYGELICKASVDDVLIECLTWQTENKIAYQDMYMAALYSKDTGESVGTITFGEGGVKFTPCN